MTTTNTMTCSYCGSAFTPKRRRADASFCSMGCRAAAHKAGQRRKMEDLERLARDFTLAHVEIREVIQTEEGKRKFYIELTGPKSVHDAIDRYCESQGIDKETYLADVGTEMLLKAARDPTK